MHIETMREIRIAYMRRTGAYGAENGALMELFKDWCGENGLLDRDAVLFGIAWDNAAFVSPSLCRYDTCLAVDEAFAPEATAVELGQIAGGRYVVFEIAHTAAAVRQAWAALFPALAAADCQLDIARPILERYQSQLVRQHRCELCIPIL